jgi:tetratricopeptide (TPR) repeat protein
MDWKQINPRYVHPAIEAWKSGDARKAESLFGEGMAASGNDGWVAFKYGEFLETEGRLAEAQEKLQIAVRRLPLLNRKREAEEVLERVGQAIQRAGPVEDGSGKPESVATGRRIGLVSCTCKKKKYSCTARELYSESSSFRRHLEFAERHYGSTFVVSAKHGLVELTQLLAPYSLSLEEYEEEERDHWAEFIVARLRLDGAGSNCVVYVHADDLYRRHLCAALERQGIPSRWFAWEGTPTPENL